MRAPHIEVSGIAAGLHAVLRLAPGTERSVLKAAAYRGLALDGLADYRHPLIGPDAMPVADGLVVGYATAGRPRLPGGRRRALRRPARPALTGADKPARSGPYPRARTLRPAPSGPGWVVRAGG